MSRGPLDACDTMDLATAGASFRRRPLFVIAQEISRDWGDKIHYAARPYLGAMLELGTIDDVCMNDSGRSIVRYFLSNAASWRGPVAKRIKAELKSMLA